jgi:hypothetical protein
LKRLWKHRRVSDTPEPATEEDSLMEYAFGSFVAKIKNEKLSVTN